VKPDPDPEGQKRSTNIEKKLKKVKNFHVLKCWIGFKPKMLEPEQESMNPDPKHCLGVTECSIQMTLHAK
jgi:hypothetical protein